MEAKVKELRLEFYIQIDNIVAVKKDIPLEIRVKELDLNAVCLYWDEDLNETVIADIEEREYGIENINSIDCLYKIWQAIK